MEDEKNILSVSNISRMLHIYSDAVSATWNVPDPTVQNKTQFFPKKFEINQFSRCAHGPDSGLTVCSKCMSQIRLIYCETVAVVQQQSWRVTGTRGDHHLRFIEGGEVCCAEASELYILANGRWAVLHQHSSWEGNPVFEVTQQVNLILLLGSGTVL